MITRRLVATTGLSLVASGSIARLGYSQSREKQSQPELRNRGAPTGRIGAATRTGVDDDNDQTLDLVAPQVGAGLSSTPQPSLCYLLSKSMARSSRFVMSLHNQSKPVADVLLHRLPPATRLGVVRLRDENVRLTVNQLYVWSITIEIDPQEPSRDLVASALVQYRPVDLAVATEFKQAILQRDYGRLETLGYWYDAVTLADESRAQDDGAGLKRVLQVLGLDSTDALG